MGATRIAQTAKEQIYEIIRSAGGRLTVPMRTLIAVLLESERHLTADDLIAELERHAPGIAPSTTYRLLQRLDELGITEHVHSGTGPAFYHLREHSHAHLICNECGTIIDIPDRVLHGLSRTIQRTYAFTLQPHHAALLGLCNECAE